MTIFDNRICHLTYTHTDCADVWPAYFGEMARFGHFGMTHILCVNQQHAEIPTPVQPLLYDDSRPYPERLLSCLERLTAFDYVFFDHEDMFLFAEPDYSELTRYYDYLKCGELDHIRLIKGGDCRFEPVPTIPSLFRLDLRSKWIFSIQPSFWKRTVLMEVLKKNLTVNLWELEVKSQKAVKKLKLKAGFSYRQGAQRGIHHFDNDVYPYIATAIGKGKWNLGEYPVELGAALNRYHINPALRGSF